MCKTITCKLGITSDVISDFTGHNRGDRRIGLSKFKQVTIKTRQAILGGERRDPEWKGGKVLFFKEKLQGA